MFSNDSRWDRHTPDQLRKEEPIDVSVIFEQGNIVPRQFVWHGRKYTVKEITYQWRERRGDQQLIYFTLSDGVNIYKIYFNNKYLHWRMVDTCPIE